MRNLFLSLVLANLLVLAWHFWVDPPAPAPVAPEGKGLALFGPVPSPAPRQPAPAAARTGGGPLLLPVGSCWRLGPLTDSSAAQQAARALAGRGVDATPFARDAQLWLGHWVQATGFDSVATGEIARERLVAGGLTDALLMQDGPQPLISLGVFRERDRADRVAATARDLGFQVAVSDRYRPGVDHWLLVQPRDGQSLRPSDLALAGDRILRAEPAPCAEARDPPPPDGTLPEGEPPAGEPAVAPGGGQPL